LREFLRNRAQKPHALDLDLPAAHIAVRMARSVLRGFARREGAPPREIETMEFVASELLANAVDHGGGNRAMELGEAGNVRMTLSAHISPEGWEIQVGDQGGGDPARIAEFLARGQAPDLEDERGRGFFLMAQMLQGLAVTPTRDGRGLLISAQRRYEAGGR